MDVFEEVTDLDKLVKMIFTQSNLCTQQNGRIFEVEALKMKVLLRINYKMAINIAPSIAGYWRVDTYIRNSELKTPLLEILLSKFSKPFISLAALGMIKLNVHS